MIRIERDSGYADNNRAYKVVLDGEASGEIRNGQQDAPSFADVGFLPETR